MPVLLRYRLALVAILGALLVPIVQSSLRGTSHVLTCTEQVAAPFQVLLQEAAAVMTGSRLIGPGDGGLLCGGLEVDMAVSPRADARVGVRVAIVNATDADWHGTVQLAVGGTRLPVELGRVAAGEREEREIVLRLPEGAVEIDGALLIGP